MTTKPPQPIYVPSNPDEKNIEKFRREINRRRGTNLKDYNDLHAYSVNPATFQNFWEDVWEYVGIKASKRSKTVTSLPADLSPCFTRLMLVGHRTERCFEGDVPSTTLLPGCPSQFRREYVRTR